MIRMSQTQMISDPYINMNIYVVRYNIPCMYDIIEMTICNISYKRDITYIILDPWWLQSMMRHYLYNLFRLSLTLSINVLVWLTCTFVGFVIHFADTIWVKLSLNQTWHGKLVAALNCCDQFDTTNNQTSVNDMTVQKSISLSCFDFIWFSFGSKVIDLLNFCSRLKNQTSTRIFYKRSHILYTVSETIQYTFYSEFIQPQHPTNSKQAICIKQYYFTNYCDDFQYKLYH